jgi:hypothetical protein
MEEPSVLDYVKSRIFFWRKERVQIFLDDVLAGQVPTEVETLLDPETASLDSGEPTLGDVPSSRWVLFPSGSTGMILRVLLTVLFALIAQSALEPPSRSVVTGLVFYILALSWLLWSYFRGEWVPAEALDADQEGDPMTFRQLGFWLFIPLFIVTFLSFGNNLFSKANLTLLAAAVLAFLYIFWLVEESKPRPWERFREAWKRFISKGISFSPWTLLVIAVFVVSAFYRFYLLDQVPAEMFSDHAEKLMDVRDVLNGQTNIFFPRNTGREAFQMYLTAAMSLLFNSGLSFLSLKLGTAFCGLFTLPFIYLTGKEIANRRVGLLAMFFAGIAYWPNVISRVALRFTLYPTFTAPVLYYLLRGLRRRKRNDFILSGIFLGLGLHGYSPYRFVPIVVVIAVGVYMLHQQSRDARSQAVWSLSMVALSSLVIFLPLLRFALSNPSVFNYRMMTRMGQAERAYPAPPIQIFFENLWKTLVMPVWDNGEIWVHSIPNRPALGIVAGAFFVLGVGLLIARYLKQRNWLDLFLLVSIPLFMMPSALALAFPEENPSLNRTGGALVVVFLIVALAFDGLLTALKSKRLSPGGGWLAWLLAAALLSLSASQNYDLVFNMYAQQFKTNAWNTSELGAVIRQFADSSGAEDSAWVVPYPHWVDTRLVGIRAGFPERDYALWPENIIDTVDDGRAKLYLLKADDAATIEILRTLYPSGVLRLYDSQAEGRDFYMYSVPPTE